MTRSGRAGFGAAVAVSACCIVLGVAVAGHAPVVLTVAAFGLLIVLGAVVAPGTLLMSAAVFVPFRVFETVIPISRGGVTLADAFLIAFVVSVLTRRRAIEGRRVNMLLVFLVTALVVISVLSMVQNGYYALGLRKIARLVTVGLALVAAVRSATYADAQRTATALVLSSAASGIVGLAFTVRAAGVPGGVLRLWGGVEDPNHMALILAAAIVVALSWRPSRVPAGVWLASILIMIVAEVGSLSRGAGLAFVIGLFALVALAAVARFSGRGLGVFSRSGAALLFLSGASALGAMLIPSDLANSAVLRYEGILDPQTDATGALRLRIWDAGLHMLSRSPWLGIGPGAFGAQLLASGTFTAAWEAHSSLIEIAVETGYLGVSVVVVMLLAGAVVALRAYVVLLREDGAQDDRIALATGALAAAACVLGGAFSLSNVLYQALFAIMLVVVIACVMPQGAQE